MIVIGAVLGVVLAGAVGAVGWLSADRLLRDEPASARGAAAILLVFLWVVAAFEALVRIGMFHVAPALAVSLAVAALLARSAMPGAPDRLRDDVRALASALVDAGRDPRVGFALVGVGAVLLAHLARGLALPPLAWDAMTYHLVHAARWVQAGALQPEVAPDHWGYYEYYAYDGDVLWAWAMLPRPGDTWLGLAPFLVAVGCALLTAALARAVGVDRPRAILAGALALATPAVMRATDTPYVDTAMMLAWAGGVLFLGRFWARPCLADAFLAGAGFGLAAGVKLTGAPLLVVAMAALVARAAFAEGKVRWGAPLLAALATLPALPGYLRAWIEQGSPLYPQTVRIGERVLLQGHPGMDAVQRRVKGTFLEFLAKMLYNPFKSDGHEHFLELGVGFAVLGLAAVVGLVLVLRDRPTRAVGAQLGLATLVFIALTAMPAARAHLTWGGGGRFLLPLVVAVAVLGARVLPSRVLAGLLVIQSLLALPRLHQTDGMAIAVVAAVLLAGAAAGSLAARRGRAALALAALVATLAVTGALHDRDRYDMYAAAARRAHPIFERQVLPRKYMTHRVWRAVDGDEPQTIAFTAGYATHNWFRYPLFGSRLQNSVVYVPPTRDGRVIDYAKKKRLARALDQEAWIARLHEAEVDVVVLGAPPPPEREWVLARTDCFEPLGGVAGAWRVLPCDRVRPRAAR